MVYNKQMPVKLAFLLCPINLKNEPIFCKLIINNFKLVFRIFKSICYFSFGNCTRFILPTLSPLPTVNSQCGSLYTAVYIIIYYNVCGDLF